MNKTFPLARPSQAARTTMWALTLIVAIICIVPTLFAPMPVKIGIVLVDGLVVGILARVVLRMDNVTFSVGGDVLDIRGDLSNRCMNKRILNIAAARRLDRTEYETIRPMLKLNGVGAPGYLSGWFLLQGGEKAYIFVTDKDKAVYVPTNEGYALFLTPDDPDGFLNALRQG